MIKHALGTAVAWALVNPLKTMAVPVLWVGACLLVLATSEQGDEALYQFSE